MSTTREIMEERQRRGWSSPVTCVEPGELRCMWEGGGIVEFMVHPDDAAEYMENGIVVDGIRIPAWQVDSFPLLNGILLRVEP